MPIVVTEAARVKRAEQNPGTDYSAANMKTKDASNTLTPSEHHPANRRVSEASALRRLFQEQWQQLRNRMRQHEALRRQERQASQELSTAVELMVTGTDGRMRAVSRYQKRLRHSTRCLLNYINESIHHLPPATVANRQAYYRDPFLPHLFGNYQEMEQLFRESQLLQPLLSASHSPNQQAVYALLACSEQKKTHFGCEMYGEMVVRDAIQTTLTFSNHHILAVARSEIDVRRKLKTWLFEHVVAYLHDYMTRLHHDRLTPSERSELPGRGEGIDDPRRYLEVLEWMLSLPLELLQIHSERLNLDRIGVIQDSGSGTGGEPVRLDELTIGDRPSRVICLLRIETIAG